MKKNIPLYIILFFAGFTGLVYEVVWTRLLTLVFGGTVYAASAVVCAFMGGLALGSWLSGLMADRQKSPLKMLALIQIILALTGLITVPVYYAMKPVYSSAFSLINPSFEMITLIRYALSVIVLILPASLIAAVFPVMSKVIISSRESAGRDLSFIYGVDTIGAVTGTVCAGFVLLPAAGVWGSIMFAVCLNVINALLCFFSRYETHAQSFKPEDKRQADKEMEAPRVLTDSQKKMLLLLFGLSGAAALSYEVLVTKVMSHFLWMHIHAVTTMLASFLFGIGLGSFFSRRFARNERLSLLSFAVAEAFIGLICVSLPFLFVAVPYVQNFLQVFFHTSLNPSFDSMIQPVLCFIIMVPPAFFMGMTMPLFIGAVAPEKGHTGKGVGAAYSVNTAGGVAGIIITTFIVIPAAGFKGGIAFYSLINMIISVCAFVIYLKTGVGSSETRKKLKIAAAGLAAAFLIIGIFSMRLSLKPLYLARAEKMLTDVKLEFFKEGSNGSVAVVSARGPREGVSRHLIVNGNPEGGSDIASLRAFQMLGNLPFVFYDGGSGRRPRKVLVLAFGMGITLGAAADYEPESITSVEIVKEVIEACPWFSGYNNDIINNGIIDIKIEDARNFLLTTDEKYDVVIIDATHPAAGDSWLLYTKECYESVKKVLAPDGVAAQWIPAHGLTMKPYLSILKTFSSVFPHITLWSSPESVHSVITGIPQGKELEWKSLTKIFSDNNIYENLKQAEIFTPYSFASFFIAGGEEIKRHLDTVPVNRDFHSPVQFTPQLVLKKDVLSIYNFLTDIMKSPEKIISVSETDSTEAYEFKKKITNVHKSAKHLRKGVYYMQSSNFEKSQRKKTDMIRKFRYQIGRAYRLDPSNRDAALYLNKVKPFIRTR